MININISDKEVVKILQTAGIFTSGVVVGLSMIKRAKKQLKKEIIDNANNQIKEDIINEIKSKIQINEIKKETIDDAKETMINDILKDANSKIENFKRDVNFKIKVFEDDLEYAKNTVFDMDKRIGSVITKSAMTIYNTINNNDNK